MYYTVIKHSRHLRTLEKSPAARVFYISLEFSNAGRVLSQCNTRLRLLYLLNISVVPEKSTIILVELFFGSSDGAVFRALTLHQCGPDSIPFQCHMWVEFVVGSCLNYSERFCLGTPVFLL